MKMSTQAQHATNAANSRLSTGPATEAVKQKAAQNLAKHYLTAKQIVVPRRSFGRLQGTLPRPSPTLAPNQRARVDPDRTDRPKYLAAHARPPYRSSDVHQNDAQPGSRPPGATRHHAITELTKLQKKRKFRKLGLFRKAVNNRPQSARSRGVHCKQ